MLASGVNSPIDWSLRDQPMALPNEALLLNGSKHN
jgi:hypothetical protein